TSWRAVRATSPSPAAPPHLPRIADQMAAAGAAGDGPQSRAVARVRAPRRDGTVNRERVLAAAAVAIKREGEKVPLATIASDARVGVGTLYRHYPTREALLAALADRSYRIV